MKKLIAWGALCALSVGCGGGDDFESDGSAELSLEDAPEELAAAACSTYLRCVPSWGALFGDEEACAESFGAQYRATTYNLVDDAVEDGRVEYDGLSGQECVDAVREASCENFDLRGIQACEDAFTGTVERGGDCIVDEECSGSDVCLFEGTCPGSCSAPLDAGDECEHDDQCEVGLVCSDETERCVAPAGEGDECEVGEPPCALPYICVGQDEDGGNPGTCMTEEEAFVGKEGEPCNFIGEDPVLCETGLACQVEDFDLVTGLVSFCRPLVETGDNCGIALPPICPYGDYCAGLDLEGGALGGTCEPAPGKGEDCSADLFTPCAPGLICLEGTCEELQANGEGCTFGRECHSGHCVDGGCTAPGGCE